MPDITMCVNDRCPSRRRCYRYMARPSPFLQSMADFKVPSGSNKCEHFWKIEPNDRLDEAKLKGEEEHV